MEKESPTFKLLSGDPLKNYYDRMTRVALIRQCRSLSDAVHALASQLQRYKLEEQKRKMGVL